MIVLAIDPGTRIAGYTILRKASRSLEVLDFGTLNLAFNQSLVVRIGSYFDFFKQKIEEFNVTVVALETPFLGKNAAIFLKLGYLRGAMYVLVSKYDLALYEYSPREVKLSLTGYGTADKEQISRMVIKLFPGLSLNRSFDLTDAFAVGITCIWRNS